MGKHIIKYIAFTLLFVNQITIAQTTDSYTQPSLNTNENYIFTRAFQKPLTEVNGEIVNPSGHTTISENSDVVENVTYFDGLGRPKQQIAIKASASGGDIITHIEYDAYGRQDKKYLPISKEGNTPGRFSTININTDINRYYKNKYPDDFSSNTPLGNINAYSQSIYEPSPLNRVNETAAPGESWKRGNGHTIRTSFEYNTVLDKVVHFDVPLRRSHHLPLQVHPNAYYKPGTLMKNIVKDENWVSGKDHTTEEFTNKRGQVLLKRTYNNNQPHDTYYVYDDHGNLRYVLPPKINLDNFITEGKIATYPDYNKVFDSSKFPGNMSGPGMYVTINSNRPEKMQIEGYLSIQNGINQFPEIQFNLDLPPRFPNIYGIMAGNLEVSTDLGTSLNTNYDIILYDDQLRISGYNHTNEKITYVRFNLDVDLVAQGYVLDKEMFKVETDGYIIDTSRFSRDKLDALAYQYKYDFYNRLVEKKIPGKGWEYIVYNKNDQPILTQDANQRPKKEWLFTKYDAFGRVVYTGLFYHSTPGREFWQNFSENYDQFESRINPGVERRGVLMYYTLNAFPGDFSKINTINYYDNYTFDLAGITAPTTVYGEPISNQTKSLASLR